MSSIKRKVDTFATTAVIVLLFVCIAEFLVWSFLDRTLFVDGWGSGSTQDYITTLALLFMPVYCGGLTLLCMVMDSHLIRYEASARGEAEELSSARSRAYPGLQL